MNILCGYNVNIDSVYRVSGSEISELLDTFEAAEILDKIDNPPGKIVSKSDFVAGLTYCMKNGCGAEWLIFEQSVFNFIKSRYFGKSLVRMGGNAGIMANALSQLGASRVIPNVAVPSKTQLSLFSKKTIYFPDTFTHLEKNAGTAPEKNKDATSNSQEPIHFVFDFSEGETFSLYGTEVRVPRENRFIATCDHLNLRLFVNPRLSSMPFNMLPRLMEYSYRVFISCLRTIPTAALIKQSLMIPLSQLRSWKAINDKLQIHLEFGHFASKEIANSVFLKFANLSDSFGMNEDELALLHNLHGVHGEGLLRMEANAVADAAFRLASRHGLKKFLIHTREFVLTVFKPDLKFNSKLSSEPESKPNSESLADLRVSGKVDYPESLILQKVAEEKLEALEFGVRCAGVYAASGRLEGRKFVEEEAQKLQESTFGRKQIESFLKAFNGKTFGQGAYAFRGGYVICMRPTLLSRSPVTTVGLGDTLTAATFLRGLELDVQA